MSAYSRELTGLRAHEITDRIQAAGLPEQVHEWVLRALTPHLNALAKTLDRTLLARDGYSTWLMRRAWILIKDMRGGPARRRWAYELGFPNPSRLAKACLLAHGKSIDELEADCVEHIVQKFLDELAKEFAKESPTGTEAGPTTSRQDAGPTTSRQNAATAQQAKREATLARFRANSGWKPRAAK